MPFNPTDADITMDPERSADSAKKIFLVIKALKDGTLQVRPQDEAVVSELLALPTGVTGLPNISGVSPKTLAFARSLGLALIHLQNEQKEDTKLLTSLSFTDAQCKLFGLFESLFVALTGSSSNQVKSPEEIKARMQVRLRSRYSEFADAVNRASGEIEQFYGTNAGALFSKARELGGVKVVTGGQRHFGPSALSATRIAGLYCDTQLIPDPIYPYFTGELHLNALHLQLAIDLYYVLPLRPLIDACLPEPPVAIFPSFEEVLELNDPTTMAGLASLAVKVVAPLLGAKVSTVDELFEYSRTHGTAFCQEVMSERLFVPPGASPETQLTAEQAVTIYLRELEGVRSADVLERMKRAPIGVLVMNGILERLRPQYHLLENADELVAQPLLSQAVHWHYFERCALAGTRELVRTHVLSKDAFAVLRALQDDSLGWLANVPIEGLLELRRNREHAELREELRKSSDQLTAAGRADLESVTREVRHGLQVLIQRQQQAIKDVQSRYSSRNWGIAASAAVGAVAGAGMMFMPSLAALAGVSAPIASAIGAVGAAGPSLAKELVRRAGEAKAVRRSMLGMLATARQVG